MDSWCDPGPVWKKVSFLEDRYEVSDEGYVRVVPYVKEYTRANGSTFRKHYQGRLLNRRVGKYRAGRRDNHLYIGIYVGDSREASRNHDHRVDTLVAAAFHGLPYDCSDGSARQMWRVQHLDGDPHNCRADNLKWVPSFGAGDVQASYNDQLTKWENRDVTVESFMDRFYSVA
ncbi:HNH endonuclease [Mycobacteroides abscessus subsp. abscessus]|uniref:HNH endonuclease n=1 Tax=Mycobacteroides abscessus TaxID=36809 RepID=UPI0019D04604|nr:HNH endonuclease [Mycobacteroides abscessus]QSN19609.1 HNH endonuclease [Mycobacteroides abscessus subsp. abscessus]